MNETYSIPNHNYISSEKILKNQFESSHRINGNIINIQCNNFQDINAIANLIFQGNTVQSALPITLNHYMEYWLENFK